MGLLSGACFCVVACVGFENVPAHAHSSAFPHVIAEIDTQENSTGTAADLDGIPPVGWPLGAPLTCYALTDQLNSEIFRAAEKLRKYCNDKNQILRDKGYQACAVDQCIDYSVIRGKGYDHGKFSLNLGNNIYTGEPQITIKYSYPSQISSNGVFPVCFDPLTRSQQVLADEFSAWDFKKFVEFCASRPESRPAGK